MTDQDPTNSSEWLQLLADMDGAHLPCRVGNGVEWTSDNPKDQALAKRYCQPCGVRTACLAFALATKQNYGVMGGQTSAERKAELRRRRRTQKAAA